MLYGHKKQTCLHIYSKTQPTAKSTSQFITKYVPEANMATKFGIQAIHIWEYTYTGMNLHICTTMRLLAWTMWTRTLHTDDVNVYDIGDATFNWVGWVDMLYFPTCRVFDENGLLCPLVEEIQRLKAWGNHTSCGSC